MKYFTEIPDYKTYAGQKADFHFSYNANSGGGQSFLGGKYLDAHGQLESPEALNGRLGKFGFATHGAQETNSIVLLEDPTVEYEIKPRSFGDRNMKLSVGNNPTPSSAIAAFLMLPEPCGIQRSKNLDASPLSSGNYWIQSMRLSVDTTISGVAVLVPDDCVICGSIDSQGNGQRRYFTVDFTQRIADILALDAMPIPDAELSRCIRKFAAIYNGEALFDYKAAVETIKMAMKYLSAKYPDRYSGMLDPLSSIVELAGYKAPSSWRRANTRNLPLQRIFYGAPGTGKSYQTNEIVENFPNTIRTTFHPDSDYATFVGCYKPTVEKKPKYGPQGLPIKANGVELTEDVITYAYVPQAFAKAYVRAWKKMAEAGADGEVDPQFLVIEEINRGNCAQIFGDLFQLLDRDDEGYSKYTIEADSDLGKFIADTMSEWPAAMQAHIPAEVRSGKKMVLPPNFYIWATMNTSDQSLFPIDSAFKRRWDWQYIPIRDAGMGWKIRVVAPGGGEGEAIVREYDWWTFLAKINERILRTTQSEDKQLGYFFAKPDEGGDTITEGKFVNKVLFYLYNDAFKDYDLPEGFEKPGGGKFAFKDFFLADGKPDGGAVKELLDRLLKKGE